MHEIVIEKGGQVCLGRIVMNLLKRREFLQNHECFDCFMKFSVVKLDFFNHLNCIHVNKLLSMPIK